MASTFEKLAVGLSPERIRCTVGRETPLRQRLDAQAKLTPRLIQVVK